MKLKNLGFWEKACILFILFSVGFIIYLISVKAYSLIVVNIANLFFPIYILSTSKNKKK